MVQGLSPENLSSPSPQLVGERSTRSLRNSPHLDGAWSRTSLYQNAILPSTISAWNSLPDEAKLVDYISDFKIAIDNNKPRKNPLFYHGKQRQ
ncbi:hypothetical protein DPMN_166161 [Dreissena polymorpha]|uniref:Uncharacterized protein n=1 Tax=Dreissena polymorpha TaxID=45954 RepID=A0A9D4IXC1_DREPO|nr:hypothetical protein DPMN_166161 [Dreissena polymorpha]